MYPKRTKKVCLLIIHIFTCWLILECPIVLRLQFDQPPEEHSFARATSSDLESPAASPATSTSTSQVHKEPEVGCNDLLTPSVVGADVT